MGEKSKKIFTVMLASFLAATFFMSSLISVEASDTLVTEEAKIDFLRSIGTTDEALSSYNPKQIDDLYNTLYGKNAVFSGYNTQIMDITESSSGEKGNIPTSQLQLTIGTYDLTSNGKVTGVDVSLGYKWLKEPVFNMTDALTFKWDSNLFYDDGFYGFSNCLVDGQNLTLESINAPALADSGSFGWYSKLSLPHHGNSYQHYGSAQTLLRPHTPFSTSANLNSKMYLTYAHQILGPEISFGLSDVGVSFAGGSFDQLSSSYTYH